MQRSNTGGKGKKSTAKTAATKDWNAGFKRRNSTSVSSLKMKQKPPTIQVVASTTNNSLTNSVDEG